MTLCMPVARAMRTVGGRGVGYPRLGLLDEIEQTLRETTMPDYLTLYDNLCLLGCAITLVHELEMESGLVME